MRELSYVEVPHRVSEGEIWETVASRSGVPEWILIFVNVNISDPFTSSTTSVTVLQIVEDLPLDSRIEWGIVDGHVQVYDTTFASNQVPPTPEPEISRSIPPDYLFHSDTEFLQWMWVNEFGLGSQSFNLDQARQEFGWSIAAGIRERINTALDPASQYPTWQLVDQGTELDQQIARLLAGEDVLSELSLDQLLALYGQLPTFQITDPSAPLTTQYRDPYTDYFAQLYSSRYVLTNGGDIVGGEAFQADLALLDFYQSHFATTDPSTVKEQFIYMVLEMFSTRQLRVEDLDLVYTIPPNIAEIEQALRARLRPEGTIEEYFAQLAQWVSSAHGEAPLELVNPELAAYYEALALDDLRQLAYAPSEIDDEARLGELEDAVLALPRALFGVDIGFVQDAFLKYVNDLKRLREVRLRLRTQLSSVELNLTGQEARPLLSWFDELLLSVLFDFFDVIFSIRDILQGNWLGLLGLLPLIPSAIAHLGEAARYALNLGEEARRGIERLAEQLGLLGGRASGLSIEEIGEYFPNAIVDTMSTNRIPAVIGEEGLLAAYAQSRLSMLVEEIQQGSVVYESLEDYINWRVGGGKISQEFGDTLLAYHYYRPSGATRPLGPCVAWCISSATGIPFSDVLRRATDFMHRGGKFDPGLSRGLTRNKHISDLVNELGRLAGYSSITAVEQLQRYFDNYPDVILIIRGADAQHAIHVTGFVDGATLARRLGIETLNDSTSYFHVLDMNTLQPYYVAWEELQSRLMPGGNLVWFERGTR